MKVAALLLLVSIAAVLDIGAAWSKRQKMLYYLKPQQKTYLWRPGGEWAPCRTDIPYSVGAHFDMSGIKGTIGFYQPAQGEPVTVTVYITGLDQFTDETWGWHVHEYSINWALLERNPCSSRHIGGHYDPENRANAPNYEALCSMNQSLCEVGDLSGRLGNLRRNQTFYTFIDNHLDLYGPYSPIGRALVIHRENGFRYACANIEYDGHQRLETYRAAFPCNVKEQSPVFQGEVIMRRSAQRCGVSLDVNLYRADGGLTNITHNWYLKGNGFFNVDCSVCKQEDPKLSVFGNQTHEGYTFSGCGATSRTQHLRCPVGEMTAKCGPLMYTNGNHIQAFCTDTQLGTYPHSTWNVNTILAIEDDNGNNIACAKFEPVPPASALVSFYNRATRTYVNAIFYQFDPHDPTYVRFGRSNFMNAEHFQIRTNPVPTNGLCMNLGPVFEPRTNFVNLPNSILIDQTGDRDYVGELRNKITVPDRRYYRSYHQRTSYLPLFGDYSIIGRSFVVLDRNEFIIGCGNITYYDPYYAAVLRRSFEGYHG